MGSGSGSKFDIEHSRSFRKEGFVTIRHNDLRDITVKILSEVCSKTEVEPKFVPLSGEDLSNRTAYRSNEARLDVRACDFCERGRQALFDLRLFDPNVYQYLNKSQQQCHVINVNEKKKAYCKRILNAKNATSFTPHHQIYYQKNVIYETE